MVNGTKANSRTLTNIGSLVWRLSMLLASHNHPHLPTSNCNQEAREAAVAFFCPRFYDCPCSNPQTPGSDWTIFQGLTRPKGKSFVAKMDTTQRRWRDFTSHAASCQHKCSVPNGTNPFKSVSTDPILWDFPTGPWRRSLVGYLWVSLFQWDN